MYRIYGQEPVAIHALDDVSLDIHAGDFMAIIGPSGSGKSTLLGLLGCLDLPTKRVNQSRPNRDNRLRRQRTFKAARQFDRVCLPAIPLNSTLTALGNVSAALLYRELTKPEIRQRSLAALEMVGLGERYDHRPIEMSSGEQQRVAIAEPWSLTLL